MERKIKTGITPAGIVSLVFSIIGGIYLILGLCLVSFPEDTEDHTAGIFFVVLGGVFIVVCLAIFCYILIKKRRLQDVYNNGKYILGEITAVLPDYDVRINNHTPYVILVRYLDRYNMIHIFKSRGHKVFPDHSIIGKQVKIYYEDESFKQYYVDLEHVLPKVIEH